MKKIVCLLTMSLLLSGCTHVTPLADLPVTSFGEDDPPLVTDDDAPLEPQAPSASNATDSYNEFMTNVPSDEHLQPLYPDTFAGAYCEENQIILHMVLTDDDAETLSYYQDFFSNPDIVVYDTATYSYNTLESMMYTIAENSTHFHAVGVDQIENCVDVSASDVDLMKADLDTIFGDTWDMDTLPVRVEQGSPVSFE